MFQAAAALFDMIEYYESAVNVLVGFNKNLGTRGWQAAAHMMRKVCVTSTQYKCIYFCLDRRNNKEKQKKCMNSLVFIYIGMVHPLRGCEMTSYIKFETC